MSGPGTGFLLPAVDDPDNEGAPFWRYCAEGELRVQRCAACGHRNLPPRPMCPECRGTTFEWERLSGRGTIYSFVVPHPPLLPAYAEQAPYNVVLVTAAEDPTLRFVGNLIAAPGAPIDSVDPATIEIGQPVRVTFEPVDDVVFPRWIRT